MWWGPLFKFETGEGGPLNTSLPGHSLYVGGIVLWGPFPGQAPPHTQTSDVSRWWATIVCNNRLFAWTIVTRRRGLGGFSSYGAKG